jgi:hypothetical protein
MQAIGEVLSARITSYVAEAWRPEALETGDLSSCRPQFGSFLKSRSEDRGLTVYGVVYDIVTGPQDQLHKPAALQKTRSQLKKEQPQIFLLLKTEWLVAPVAYRLSGRCCGGLPPLPPEVHDFVYPLEPEELAEASENLEFLRMLLLVPGVPSDELLAAAVRNAAESRHNDYKYLVDAGQQISRLLKDDYERLGSVLKRIRT